MNISRAAFAQGLAEMLVNPLRTSLSTLGVVMGIASVIATLALADGFERFIRGQISAQTDVQAVSVTSRTQVMRDGFSFPNRTFPVFGAKDAEELHAYLGGDVDVTMTVGGQTIVSTPTARAHAAAVTASLANFLLLGDKDVFAGRYFSDAEVSHNTAVVVLSYRLASELAPDRRAISMIGRDVRVRGRAMTVVGVMPSYTGETTFQVFVPLRAAAMALGARQRLTPSIFVRAPSIETVEATHRRVSDWLATRYRHWEDQVTVTTQLARLEQALSGMATFKIVMAAFAGIALIVGGVGIMNVLLASVTERTREIGVRKALGARRRDILYQFLAESIAIASLGSGLGTVVGLIAAFSIAAFIRWQSHGAPMRAVVTPATLLTAIIAAVSIGLLFGTFPALRASRLSPIDAIRHE